MLSNKQSKQVLIAFNKAANEQDFDRHLAKLGLEGGEHEKEISDLIFAIATNKPVPKSNG